MQSKFLLVNHGHTWFVHGFVCDSLTDAICSKDLFFNFGQWTWVWSNAGNAKMGLALKKIVSKRLTVLV